MGEIKIMQRPWVHGLCRSGNHKVCKQFEQWNIKAGHPCACGKCEHPQGGVTYGLDEKSEEPEEPQVRHGHEILTCEQCGKDWERKRTRGRKPRFCPTCKDN